MPRHAPGDYLVSAIECVLSNETRIYMVNGWGSEPFHLKRHFCIYKMTTFNPFYSDEFSHLYQ